MTKRLAISFILCVAVGLLIGAPAARADLDTGLLDPVESLLPSPLPLPGEVAEKAPGTVGGLIEPAPDTGRAGSGDDGSSTAPAGGGPGPATVEAPKGTTTVTDPAAGATDSAPAAGPVRAPQWPVADDSQPIGSQLGTLASNAASLARPLSIPLGMAVAAVAALIVATRRPRRLAKVDDEGTWGHGGKAWRL